MTNFKQSYNYDTIIKYNNYDAKTLCSLMKNNRQKISIDTKNIVPENFNYSLVDFNIPIKFEILSSDIFQKLLSLFAKDNSFISGQNIFYNVSFGDNKLFIQDMSNDSTNLIYSYKNDNNNSDYELLYIIIMSNNRNLLNLLNYCEYNQTFEEFITTYGINLTETNPQVILDENFKNLGEFYNVKPHSRIRLKEPKHCLGLENIGATCYMNATLQCLCHVLNVKNYFKDRQLVYKDTINHNCPLTLDFYKVVNNLWKESYRGKKYYTPTDFKNRISIMNPLFQGIAANDSKDLILFLYETMHNEINKVGQYIPNNNYNNNTELQLFRNNYYSKNSSILIKTFYFEQQSDLKCLYCQFSKSSYNITNMLIFPLEKIREYLARKNPNGFWSVTLENCFENYQEPEILSGMNQIYCNNCRRQANASTRNSMYTSPEVLTIILNRGKGLEFQVEFEYPLILNLDKFVNDKNSNNKYELIAVLTHIGPSGMAGHFIAFCKSPDENKWYCYNDADVQEVIDPRQQNNDQIEGIPYVLYYQRYNPSKGSKKKDYDDNSSYNYQQKYNSKNYNKKDYNKSYEYSNYKGKGIEQSYYYKNSNQITLYFQYEEKEVYLDLNENEKFHDIIKKLNKQYNIPRNVTLFLQKGNNMNTIEEYSTVKYNRLNNEDKIIVIDN
jgi:ubiquitin C-terminal hydrolase